MKHSLQFGLIVFALYTALSRVSDYKHHCKLLVSPKIESSDTVLTGSDVLAGSILGIGVAVIIRFGIAGKKFEAVITESDEIQKLPFHQERVSGVTSF